MECRAQRTCPLRFCVPSLPAASVRNTRNRFDAMISAAHAGTFAKPAARTSCRCETAHRCAVQSRHARATFGAADSGASSLRVLSRPSRSVRLESARHAQRRPASDVGARCAVRVRHRSGQQWLARTRPRPSGPTLRAFARTTMTCAARSIRCCRTRSMPSVSARLAARHRPRSCSTSRSNIRLMHAETLAYMINQSSVARRIRRTVTTAPPRASERSRAHPRG